MAAASYAKAASLLVPCVPSHCLFNVPSLIYAPYLFPCKDTPMYPEELAVLMIRSLFKTFLEPD
jgi:hypothetical protein